VVSFLTLQTQPRQLPSKIFRIKNQLEVIGSTGVDRKMNLFTQPNLLRPVVVDFSDFVNLTFPFKPQRVKLAVLKKGDHCDGFIYFFVCHGGNALVVFSKFLTTKERTPISG